MIAAGSSPSSAPSSSSASSSALLGAVHRIESDGRLDALAERAGRVVAPLTETQFAGALRGEGIGHALHPLLTDFPLGCWLSAGLLDLVGGRSGRRAAQRLVGLGLLAVPPTVASGAVDWASTTDVRARRVGVVHGVGNLVVGTAYWRSWRARRRGRHLRGVAWGLAGGTLAWGTGYLGGHLSLARGVGTGERGAGADGAGTSPAAALVGGARRIDRHEAGELLDVTDDRIDVLAEQGVLTADRDGRFDVAEVRAARLLGG